MYKRGHIGVSFLLYAPLAYALIRYDTAFTPMRC